MKLFSFSGENIDVRHSLDKHPEADMFPMHAHRKCEIYFFISGVGHYTVEGNDYILHPGTTLIMRDGEAHKLHIGSGAAYERVTVNFPINVVDICREEIYNLFYDRPLGFENLFIPEDSSRKYINDNLERMLRVAESNAPEAAIKFYLTGILLELVNIKMSSPLINGINSQNEPQAEGADLVSSIITFINSHLTEIHSLDVFEQKFFFSKSYMNRVFKESTGSSIWDYVVLKRLLLARSLMKDGKPAAVASAECGFCDYSSFYRQYKRRFGISPINDRNIKKGQLIHTS